MSNLFLFRLASMRRNERKQKQGTHHQYTRREVQPCLNTVQQASHVIDMRPKIFLHQAEEPSISNADSLDKIAASIPRWVPELSLLQLYFTQVDLKGIVMNRMLSFQTRILSIRQNFDVRG